MEMLGLEPQEVQDEFVWISRQRWNAERTENLRSLVAQGKSAAVIASEIGMTRNAVIGKCHRMGLALIAKGGKPKACKPYVRKKSTRGPRTKQYPQHSRAQRLVARKKTLAELFKLDALCDLPPDQSPLAKTILELIDSTSECRFPVTTPAGDPQLFCACDVVEGFPYCARHCLVAYRRGA